MHSQWSNRSLSNLIVLNDNLGFAVRSQPWKGAVLSQLGHLLANLTSKHMGVWMEGLAIPLIGGITKHEALVAGSHIFFRFVGVDGGSDLF
jgi:hypothetical protein